LKRAGNLELFLHGGKAPTWLTVRMKKLASAILAMIVEEYGGEKLLNNLSDPLWFQALSCVLAYDWDSSGSTTVTCGVLKDVLNAMDLGVKAVGGKGRRSRRTPDELAGIAAKLDLDDKALGKLQYSSRMCAKVDSTAIQAGYQLYHHTMFVIDSEKWAVVQQGMNPSFKTARRYHWLSEAVRSFVEEPHKGIVGQRVHERVLDMTSRGSGESREICTDLASEDPERLRRQVASIRPLGQDTLGRWLESTRGHGIVSAYAIVRESQVNWGALEEAYRIRPTNYEELLAIRGLGPSTARALALVAEIAYGAKTSWRDPVKFSFAFGGKDGIPFPVKRATMDKSISLLKEAIDEAKLGREDKLQMIRRLRSFTERT